MRELKSIHLKRKQNLIKSMNLKIIVKEKKISSFIKKKKISSFLKKKKISSSLFDDFQKIQKSKILKKKIMMRFRYFFTNIRYFIRISKSI